MGRKQSRLSGLSLFAKEAFSTSINDSNNVLPSPSLATASSSRKISEANIDQTANPQPAKKRKFGLLGVGNESYDATGLVPHYTDPSEVPNRLRKCEHTVWLYDCVFIYYPSRLLPETEIFLVIL